MKFYAFLNSAILCRAILCCVFCALTTLGDLEVCLKDEQGCLQGTLLPGYRTAVEFEAFMGIPYAQPPVGELRFQNPLPAAKWQGVLNASAPRDHCLQKNYIAEGWPVLGDEDCLYLNVYRPLARNKGEELPVMVYFHGGGYFSGSAHPALSGPTFLMDTQRVLMVSVGYRLGAFGFLSTGDAHMSGNWALKDQRLALRWVRQHIGAFGGDAQLVTIFGHSVGGSSTHFHMLSDSSKGLFHRAMSLSGTALAPFVQVIKQPLEQAQKLATHLGVAEAQSLSSQELAAALRQVDALALVHAGDALKQWDVYPLFNFRPVVEQETSLEPFFIEDPVQTHLQGGAQQVPWLLTQVSRSGEGAIFLLHILETPELLAKFNGNFEELFISALDLQTKHFPKDLLKLYGTKGQLSDQTLRQLSKIAGDFNFQYPLYESAASYAKYSKQPLYIFSFKYRGLRSFSSYIGGSREYEELGAVHMDDALHTMHMPVLIPDFPLDSEDAKVIERMTHLLVDFAITGIFHNESTSCSASQFTSDEMCNYWELGQAGGVFSETLERHADTRALPIWRKLYL